MNGILLIDKPRGWTSHDVVAALRRSLPRRTKVGHAGTLDPLATGLLVVLIGQATKTARHFQGMHKVYSGRIRLGIETDTGDLEGKIVRELPVPPLSRLNLQRAFESHQGTVELAVPSYSAVKYKGRPLYSYARAGIEVPLKNRTHHIFQWDLLDWLPPEAGFRLKCSGGTYVRSLAVSVGRSLGCAAVVSELRREAVGHLSLQAAIPMERAKSLGMEELSKLLEPVNLPSIAQ